MNKEMKVSDQIALLLKKMDIRHIFGIIGAGNVHLFDSISNYGYTEIVCVHHEQAATMAMQTYYRSSGRICAALLTTGGGVTNGLTGVVSGWADSIPGIVIAGNEHSKHALKNNRLRMWGVQGFDSVKLMKQFTKYSVRVTDPKNSLLEIEKAVEISLNERPGPVWVEIPMDIQAKLVKRNDMKSYKGLRAVKFGPLSKDIQSVVKSLKTSKRPLLWLGHGIRLSGAVEKLPILLNQLNIPALLSWAGVDMVDSNHPRILGRGGVYGQRAANFTLQNCDYLLSIGTRLAIPQIGYDLKELAREATIDTVDIDDEEGRKLSTRINRFIKSDAGEFITELLNHTIGGVGNKSSWLKQCDVYQKKFPWIGKEHEDTNGFINSYRFQAHLNKFFKPNQIVVTDMGAGLLCSHQVMKFSHKQRLMTSTGLGEMGYGLPAAIGASFANNRAEVMCLNCDGGMMLNIQELQTIVHHNLPIKIFIFNNDGYLMIKNTQKALFGKERNVGTDKSSGLSCPNFSKVAAGFEIPAYQIHDWEKCDDILDKVQSLDGPVICEVFMDPEQLYTPKLATQIDSYGSLISPPLEDLSPLIKLNNLSDSMIVPVHPKSLNLNRNQFDIDII